MAISHAARDDNSDVPPAAPAIDLGPSIEAFMRAAPNNAFLATRLTTLDDPDRLIRFLHRFVVFNDALAARVPFLAGLIHLTPDLFVDVAVAPGFLGQVNGRIAAHVAAAANDEYQMTPGCNMVHQHLSQTFLRGALAHYRPAEMRGFERDHPIPPAVGAVLSEARSIFFAAPDAHAIFAALGFHVGLEFFANEEFNLVDRYLRRAHPALVAALEHGCPAEGDYAWLALHTIVEVGHYRAGLEAVNQAVAQYRDPAAADEMAEAVMQGLAAFAALQQQFYQAVFAEAT
jgi:hypothetical protein